MSAKTTNVAADGSLAQATLGPFQYFFVRALSHPVEVSFDGTQWAQLNLNDRLTLLQKPTRVYFRALNGLAAIVTYQYSMQPFQAQDTAVSVSETDSVGNQGKGYRQSAPQAQVTGGGGWNPSGAANPDLGLNNLIFVPGVVNGRKRKQITFITSSAHSHYFLAVFSPDGGLFEHIPENMRVGYETSSDFYLAGSGGVSCDFSINEIFYKDQ